MPARLDTTACPTPRWLPEGHSQTIYAALCASHHRVGFARERVETPDGDFIDLDWTAPGLVPGPAPAGGIAAALAARKPSPRGADALALFHGLEGSSASHYAQAIAQHFRSRGWTVVVPHFRGCSGEPNRLPRAYHSGDSAELGFMLETVRQRAPDARWHAAGVSLGGNVLLKYLGEQGAAAGWLAAAAGISAPLDLTVGGHALGHGFVNRRLYTPMFLRTLKSKTLQKAQKFPGTVDVIRVANARDLKEFDDAYTAPTHGFRNADDYWARASSKPLLGGIAVPTLVLNARNDPFLPAHCLPEPKDASDAVLLHQPRHGGHVGFATGRFPTSLGWLPARLATFFRTGD
ncbi:alpha/beta fold hydrolase [Pigmentiphaga soli]|uniref:Alpha/beta fold hydrolase n=1 Tax=Pigmentiphaga soli TaxID=1007095 RepID=A0ABP8GBQ6_9BURK